MHPVVLTRRARRRLNTVIGLVLMPLLIASGLLWVVQGSTGNIASAEAAIVNLDQGATLDGRPVRLGQDYALQLKQEDGPNFTWRYGISLEQAEAGLAQGRYAAAVVIPPGFSRVLTGSQPQRGDDATLVVERSPITGVGQRAVFDQLQSAAAHALSGGITRNYLEKLFVADVELGKALGRTTLLAQEARTEAAQADREADGAAGASAELVRRARAAQQAGEQLATQGGAARTSAEELAAARDRVETATTTTVEGNTAQRQALQQAAQRAAEVSRAAADASDSSRDVAGRATAVGQQGGAASRNATAVAGAAAANSKAAASYTSKVGGVVEQQRRLRDALRTTAGSLDQYVDSSQQVADAVKGARRTLADTTAAVVPASLASSTATQRTARAQEVVNPPLPVATEPVPTTTPTPAPRAEAEQLATQVAAQADELRTVASSITGDAGQLETLGAQAQQVATAATGAVEANQQVVDQSRTAVAQGTLALGSINTAIQEVGEGGGGTVDGADCQARTGQNANSQYCTGWVDGHNAAADGGVGAGQLAQLRAARAHSQQTLDASRAALAGAQQASTQLAAVSRDADQLRAASSKLSDELTASASRLRTIAKALDQVATQVRELAGTPQPELQQQLQQLDKALNGPQMDAALAAVAQQAPVLTEQAAENLAAAEQGVQQVQAVAPGSAAAKTLTAGAASLGTTAQAQLAIVTQLRQQLSALNEGMDDLGAELGGLSEEAATLRAGTAAVGDRSAALARQVEQLNEALGGLQGAATRAAQEAVTTEQRARALQAQVTALQQTGSQVQQQTTTVSRTTSTVVDRTTSLVRQVESNQEQLPNYSPEERVKLTSAVTTPIDTVEHSSFRNVGWVSMLLVLSLWFGAMALHSLFPAVSIRARRSTSRPAVLLLHEMAPAVMIGVLQALAVSAAGQVALRLPFGRWMLLTGLLVVASTTFLAVNHALVAFGRVLGRVAAVACALITGATLISSAYPAPLELLRRLSPVTPTVDVSRTIMTGAPTAPFDLTMVVAWLAAGALFSALAILRARDPEPVRVHTVHDEDPPA